MSQFLKRLCVYILIGLLVLSIYKDITKREQSSPDFEEHMLSPIEQHDMNLESIHIQAQPGDTVLSVTEILNSDLHTRISIESIISDFKNLNPGTDPYNLKAGNTYLFPLYDDNS